MRILLIFDIIISEEQLLIILMDLFCAGAETTSTTLTWALINLINYPKVQERVHDEIDHILGSSTPTLEHKEKLVLISNILCKMLLPLHPHTFFLHFFSTFSCSIGSSIFNCTGFRLLYTEAFLMETFRYNCIVPFAVPHRAKQTFTMRGK